MPTIGINVQLFDLPSNNKETITPKEKNKILYANK